MANPVILMLIMVFLFITVTAFMVVLNNLPTFFTGWQITVMISMILVLIVIVITALMKGNK